MDSPTPQPESPYETQRRMENIVRKGTVAAVRLAAPARVRVKTGDNTTDWLPWIALRAGGVAGGRTWNPAVVGEQCTVLAPGGDLAQAVVLLGLYSDAMPQGSEQAACDRTDWDEDNYFEWLRGALTAYCMESITLSTPNTSVHMEGSTVTITGGGAPSKAVIRFNSLVETGPYQAADFTPYKDLQPVNPMRASSKAMDKVSGDLYGAMMQGVGVLMQTRGLSSVIGGLMSDLIPQ